MNSFFNFVGDMYEEYVWSDLGVFGVGGAGSVCECEG